MVQGCSSGAGKSVLVTALCRLYARRGVRVAPFKAQNMSNHARPVKEGEIGSAQYFQALAAGLSPEARMNPVLIKPEGDQRAQLVVLGRPAPGLAELSWRQRRARLWPVVRTALAGLLAEYELVVIEGAGSPAEINLQEGEIVNMRVAREARASVLLVADIDRGGAFAHLYGTWAFLDPEDRALLVGFVLNKFRGNASLLAPAPERLRALTGVPTLGVLPWLEHGLPEEDAVFDRVPSGAGFSVAVVVYPTASNLDEFEPLRRLPGVRLIWADRAEALEDAELVVLPGSKHVTHDLSWLRTMGLDRTLSARVRSGRPVLAICGGLQLLGERLDGSFGVEADGEGLGLMPYRTVYGQEKRTGAVRVRFGELEGFWAPLSGLEIAGYEIRQGRTLPTAPIAEVLPEGLGYQQGVLLVVYTHGLFENPAVRRALFGQEGRSLEPVFDRLADWAEQHLNLSALEVW